MTYWVTPRSACPATRSSTKRARATMPARNHRVPSGSISGRRRQSSSGAASRSPDLVLEDVGRRIDLDVHGSPERNPHRRSLRSLGLAHVRQPCAPASLSAAGSGHDTARQRVPRHRSARGPDPDAATRKAPNGTRLSRRREVSVMAAKEKGRAGQECPPCPNTVTSSAAANPFGVRNLRRFHRAGSQRSSPGAALRLVSGSRVATVMPEGISSGPSSRSMVNGARVKRAMMERCAIRVDSSAQVSARPVLPSRTCSASSGCSMQIDEMPAQRGEQVGHGRNVDERDVEADPRRRLLRFRVGPRVDDPIEECVPAVAVGPVLTRPSSLQPEPELRRDLGQRGALLGLVGGGHAGHGVGVHEGLRTVEPVEGSDQGLEALALGRARAAPGGQSDPVAQAPAEREEIDLAFRAQFVGRGLDRQLHVAQVGGDVLPPEQLVRQHPPAGEHLVGQLASEHPPVGHTLAGRLLRQAVQRGDAQGREEEEVPIVAAVHDEGVPEA